MSTVRSITVELTGDNEPGSPGEITATLLNRLQTHIDRVNLAPLLKDASRMWQSTFPYDLPRTTYLQDEAARFVMEALAQAVLHEVARSLDRGFAIDMAIALSMFLNPVETKETAS